MKVSVLVVCVAASLASLVHAQDWAAIRRHEGQACKDTEECTYPDYHRCTGPDTGCQPFMGTFRAPCDSDQDCQYGLSCRKDQQVSLKDIQAHLENGGSQSQKVNGTGIQRCFGNSPPTYPHRLNPEKRKIYDYAYKTCEGNEDCPDKSCLFGVCLIRPGAENAFCKGSDWCRDGNLCADLSQLGDDHSNHPEADEQMVHDTYLHAALHYATEFRTPLVISALLAAILYKYRSHAVGAHPRRDLKEPKGAVPLLGHLPVLASYSGPKLYEFLEKQNHELGPVWSISLPLFGRMIQGDKPELVEYVLKTNFPNYIKGPMLKDMLADILGVGFFLADGPDWRFLRNSWSRSLMSKRSTITPATPLSRWAIK
ncbi:unnamed protein product [Mortierella alpina]